MVENYEDPYEKYDEFEEQFYKKGGGGGGGPKKERDPHSKTSKAARRISIEHAKDNRSVEAFNRLTPVVDSLLKGLNEHETEAVATEYVKWINLCITTRQLHLDKRDVEEETTRGSGPGGQNVNKVSSAVRLIHTITGIDAESSEGRDQPINRNTAYDKLQERLAEHLDDWLTVLKEGNTKAKPRALEISDII